MGNGGHELGLLILSARFVAEGFRFSKISNASIISVRKQKVSMIKSTCFDWQLWRRSVMFDSM